MGFGLLFIGYFFMLNFPFQGIDLLPDVVGCIIMLVAVRKLLLYCDDRGFRYAEKSLYPFTIFALALLFYQLADFFGFLPDTLADIYYVFMIVYSIVVGAYHIFLLYGIYTLSKSVSLDKLSARATRMVALTAVYYIAQILNYTNVTGAVASLTNSPEVLRSYINLAVYLISIVWMLLTWKLIFSCYVHICLEGDEDMPYHEDIYDKIINYMNKFKKR